MKIYEAKQGKWSNSEIDFKIGYSSNYSFKTSKNEYNISYVLSNGKTEKSEGNTFLSMDHVLKIGTGGRGDEADFLFSPATLRIYIRMMRRLVAFNIEFYQSPVRAPAFFLRKSASTVEIFFLEIDQPVETELKRRSRTSRTNGDISGQEVHIGGNESSFDT